MRKQQRSQLQKNVRILVECLLCAFWSILVVWAMAVVAHAHAREVKAYVGPNCMQEIHITDFRKPCVVHPQDNNPNMAHCDDVVIRFACLEYKQAK